MQSVFSHNLRTSPEGNKSLNKIKKWFGDTQSRVDTKCLPLAVCSRLLNTLTNKDPCLKYNNHELRSTRITRIRALKQCNNGHLNIQHFGWHCCVFKCAHPIIFQHLLSETLPVIIIHLLLQALNSAI